MGTLRSGRNRETDTDIGYDEEVKVYSDIFFCLRQKIYCQLSFGGFYIIKEFAGKQGSLIKEELISISQKYGISRDYVRMLIDSMDHEVPAKEIKNLWHEKEKIKCVNR
ncbi:MAG: hypothetical protein KKH44_07810 [Bacteroidetes bacterium]|nr:hypothetical protein [Bacteroidota bacterium]